MVLENLRKASKTNNKTTLTSASEYLHRTRKICFWQNEKGKDRIPIMREKSLFWWLFSLEFLKTCLVGTRGQAVVPALITMAGMLFWVDESLKELPNTDLPLSVVWTLLLWQIAIVSRRKLMRPFNIPKK